MCSARWWEGCDGLRSLGRERYDGVCYLGGVMIHNFG